ncbi:MAG: hypothetical protein H7210_10525 [Pyrinomonadaceae bacterium]|nr:hypothetical protein [Phycisphaerales bacterium]
MNSCCSFRSTLKVLAVVGAVSALSATTVGQSLDKGAKKAPASTNAARVVKAPVPVQPPAPITTGTTKGRGVQHGTTSPGATGDGGPTKSSHQIPGRTLSGGSGKATSPVAPRGASNDECTAPVVLTGSPASSAYNNAVNTTGSSGQGNAACLFFSQSNINNDEWFLWTATATGSANATTCGFTGDTKIAAYNGATCPPGAPIGCNDDACGLLTTCIFPVISGNQYLIQVGTYPGGANGTGTVTITGPGSGGPCTDNDCCAMATVVSVPSTTAYNLTGATNDWPGTCGATATAPDRWFSATAPSSGTMVVSTCGSSVDTVITVLDECGGPQIVCLDDFCGLQTEVSFAVVAGEDYLIRMAGFNGAANAASFSVSMLGPCVLTCRTGTPEGEPCGTDTNGGCNSPSPVFGSISCGETVLGTAFADGTTRDTDWYDLNPGSGARQITVTCEAAFPWQLLILDTNCPPAIIGATTGSRCVAGSLTATVVGPCRVFVSNSGFAGNLCGADNDYCVTVTECLKVEGAANDLCTKCESISGEGTFNYDNSVAGTDGVGDPLCLAFGTDQISNDVWFCWTSTCENGEQAILEFCGLTAADTKVAVYDGTSCTGPILACNDDSCGLQSRVSWLPVNGQSYLIRVGNFPGAVGGPGAFTIRCAEVLPPVCTGFNPATDCQDKSFVDGYNCTNFGLAEGITSNVPVTEMCINGIYFGNAVVPDAWVITFLFDLNGRPDCDRVKDTFTQGVDMVVTGPSLKGGPQLFGRDVYEWHFVFSRPVASPVTQCKWVQMQNFATGDSVFIQTAVGGDGQVAQDLGQDGCYGPTDVQPNDVAICINGGFRNNALCFQDPCAGINPANDDCADAIALTAPSTTFGTTSCATTDGTVSCSGIGNSGDVWYTVVGNGRFITVDTCSSAFYDTTLEVYSGTCAGGLVCEGGNDDFCGLQSSVTFCSVPGRTYLINVHGFAGATGDFDISVTKGEPCGDPCPCDFNDDGFLNSQDFFDFLVAFFGNLPSSDFNGDGLLNSQDFFDFLACFFAPPPGCA